MNLASLRSRMHARFDLSTDQDSRSEIDKSLRAGVEFRGTALWVLFIAILIASIGLNVNSTAVIIGAMLISPLMGPIMALGYGVGINDSALIRSSLFNLSLAVVLSLLASTLYFLLTPLSQAHSELLSRTSPAIWDVLIAFLGGLAGIIGITRRQKSNLLPGVAIATALMPPLCTAGYGLAMQNAHYFFGAFYLFTINCVFIAMATLLMVRWMGLPSVKDVSGKSATRKRTVISIVVLLTLLPSLFLAYRLVEKELFERAGMRFIREQLKTHAQTLVLSQELDFDQQHISVTLTGKGLNHTELDTIQKALPTYGLAHTTLSVNQSVIAASELSELKSELLQEFMRLSRSSPGGLTEVSTKPPTQSEVLPPEALPSQALLALHREIVAQFPDALSVSVTQGQRIATAADAQENAPAFSALAINLHLVMKKRPTQREVLRLRRGLQARFGLPSIDDVAIFIQPPSPSAPPHP